MKKVLYIFLGLMAWTAVQAVNDSVRFYWHHVQLEAGEGGYIYATGDWRLPQSEDEFGSSVTVKWVIAGTNGQSSCYAWAQPEEGYYFAGWYAQNGTQLLTTDTVEARLRTTTTVAQTEDGIVSGNVLYDLQPSDTIRAVFLSYNTTAAPVTEASEQSERTYDIMGRIIRTSENGVIHIKGGKKWYR
ncbi:MAG: hypothetical protein IKN59_05450 [Paludibacteraceae bacterium]|nr:hypothetical protein [Paludibacteraceae bacterium]